MRERHVIVARDYKNRVKVIGPSVREGWVSAEHAQRELDFIRPLLGNGVVDVRVVPIESALSVKA